ncbi:acyl-CoA thioesterase [Stakelama sediminis]|uniref:Acyl-CoA thioesterase YciA n=1 Tax=Stakelama sediminis TaxID=463200 RepID=A0A840YVA5_9SPHN|nr:acyl-CoA thioesterase [Stakelama sediminis]MBB5717573.1 acyl-CoA thioesterase YciA [Stakelama sediminis]
MDDCTPPDAEPALRVTAMPADTNPYGDIFGGWLMSQMDMAAGLVSSRYSRGRAVTVAVEGMKFHHPVSVGDEVSVYAELVATGRTSMTIEVEAWRRGRFGESHDCVTQARFVFVAVDENKKPRSLVG